MGMQENSFLGLSSYTYYRGALAVTVMTMFAGTAYSGYKLLGWFLGWDDTEAGEETSRGLDDGAHQEALAEFEHKVDVANQNTANLQVKLDQSNKDFKLFYIIGTVIHLIIIAAFIYMCCTSPSGEEELYPQPVDGEDMV